VVVEPDGVEAEGIRLRPVSGDCIVADTLLRRLDAEAEGGGGHAWRYTIDGGATSSPNDLVDSCARFAFSECHEARDRPRDMENAEFERLVAGALDDIPAEFARLLANVTVVVEEEPPPRLLLALGLDPARESLYGLYQGVPLSRRPHDFAGLPDRITIFAGPLLRNCPTHAALRQQIRKTVVHEIAHFFGLDERRVRGLGY